ncbi:MAG: chloride channel protein [Acidimicrobiales bacterium]
MEHKQGDESESERQRVPQPIIKKRIASGRGAMEQPNITHDGDAALTPTFWLAIVITGIGTGLFGAFLMWVLQLAETAAFNYHSGSYQNAVAATSGFHRVAALMISSAIGAVGWYFIRRYLKNEKSEIDDSLWNGDGELSMRRSFLTSIVSELVIGLGASIGREAAPKLMGGASGSVTSHWLKLSSAQKRLLVACGGGAGLAAVYNVPLGGAIFTTEVLLGSFALPNVLPALACSLIATVTGWIYLPRGATYTDIPFYNFSSSLMVWSLFAGVLIGLLAVFYIRLIGWASHFRAKGASIFWAMPLTFLVVGICGIWYPQLFGNGKDMAHEAFLGVGGIGLLFALFALKPLVTAITISGGASGGVFTPFLSTGAVLGGFLGAVWLHMWPGAPIGAFAMVGAAAMIGSSMQAPLTGMVLVAELTHSGFNIIIPMMAATLIATFLVRHIDGYSIYSARLPNHGVD